MTKTENPYLGVPVQDLKTLRRTRKESPETVALIDAAIAAAVPFHAGTIQPDAAKNAVDALEAVVNLGEGGVITADLVTQATSAIAGFEHLRGAKPARQPKTKKEKAASGDSGTASTEPPGATGESST